MRLPDLFSRLVSPKLEWKVLIGFSLLILIVQIVFLRKAAVVGETYWIAINLQKGLGFAYYFPGQTVATTATSCFIPPLYCFILYVVLLAGGGTMAMQILGLLFFHAGNITIYHFFKRHIDSRLALTGFFLLGLYIPQWILTQHVDPDGFNLLLVALTILQVDRLKDSSALKQWGLLGILIGLQLLTRPDMLIGALCFCAWLLWRSNSRAFIIKRLAFTLGIGLLVVLPWTIRNYIVFDRFILISANSGYNFFLGNNPSATGEFDQGPATAERLALDSAQQVYFATHLKDPERDDFLKAQAIGWIKTHTAETISLDLKKFLYHWWSRDSVGNYLQMPGWTKVLYSAISIILVVLGLFGLWFMPAKPRSLLVTLFLYSSIISTIFFAQTRHRAIKCDPYLVTLCVVGVHRIFTRKS